MPRSTKVRLERGAGRSGKAAWAHGWAAAGAGAPRVLIAGERARMSAPPASACTTRRSPRALRRGPSAAASRACARALRGVELEVRAPRAGARPRRGSQRAAAPELAEALDDPAHRPRVAVGGAEVPAVRRVARVVASSARPAAGSRSAGRARAARAGSRPGCGSATRLAGEGRAHDVRDQAVLAPSRRRRSRCRRAPWRPRRRCRREERVAGRRASPAPRTPCCC